jgi:hypothetical protein
MGRKSSKPEFLEATVGKFTFRVATDRLCTEGHL